MRIVAIYPGLNPRVNDIASVLKYLAQRGHELVVITARSHPSKSTFDAEEHEFAEGYEIRRPFNTFFPEMILSPGSGVARVRDSLVGFRPDIILCSHELSIRVANAIKSLFVGKVAVVVVTEFAGDLMRRGYAGKVANIVLPLVGIPRGKGFWPWLCQHADAVVTCYPGDKPHIAELGAHGTPVFYVPWCNQLPEGFRPSLERDRYMAVYIGHFSRWKNTDAFEVIVPRLLHETPMRRIVFVGSGAVRVVKSLAKTFGDAIEHVHGMPRQEALALLSRAFFGVTPVKRGGWGFIGDCWAVRTPLVALHNDYDLRSDEDALVVSSMEKIAGEVNRLYASESVYLSIQQNGYRRYLTAHTAEPVGAAYELVLEKTLARVGA